MDTSDHIARARGRREGLAIAALAGSIVAYLNLLGAEKAGLAIVLAVLAMRGAPDERTTRRRSVVALSLAALYVATIALVLFLFHDKLSQLIGLLRQLG